MAGGGGERGLFLMSRETAQLITYERQITDSKLSTVGRNKIPMWTIKASTWWKGQRFLIEQAAGYGPRRAVRDAWGGRWQGRHGLSGLSAVLLSKSSRRFWGWQAALWALFSSHALLTAGLLATNLGDTRDGERSVWGGKSRAKALESIRYLPWDAAGHEARWRRLFLL